MTLLVTDGAGFIGGNFVLDCLAYCDDTIVNLDNLTYAGNLHTLAMLRSCNICSPHMLRTPLSTSRRSRTWTAADTIVATPSIRVKPCNEWYLDNAQWVAAVTRGKARQ